MLLGNQTLKLTMLAGPGLGNKGLFLPYESSVNDDRQLGFTQTVEPKLA